MKTNNNLFDGDICSPIKFQASGINAGIKQSGTPDMSLILSELPAVAAGVFTASKIKAAPVNLCIKRLQNNEQFRAIIVNSGNANACTGQQGDKDAETMANKSAELLALSKEEIFVASTGRIGVYMPMDIILNGIEEAVKSLNNETGHAARAIMTTDTKPKSTAVKFNISGQTVTIGGIAKGAGMIAPNMQAPHATMLAFITTDANIERSALQAALNNANSESFNKITVDGDMSTNDTVIVLANSAAKNETITKDTEAYNIFEENLKKIMEKLAKDIVWDAEGATKFVTVKVINAVSLEDAELSAKAISNSLLCKTAWFGCDPNWGRIIAAAGYSGANLNPEKVSLFYNQTPVVKDGCDAGTPEEELADLMRNGEFTITLDLAVGNFAYEAWTSDISYEYVKINADYHT
jgi:glutamate N-acetyltransferase/amino-acid N-acetyltransferase